MTKFHARIDNWQVRKHPSGCDVLIGKISGHVNQDNFVREQQTTSRLLKIDVEAGIAETLNTIYTLGTPYVDATN